MARIRTIKPEFFTSEDIVSLSPLARLLYIATWCEADKEGRLLWKPKTFKLRYFPGDSCDIEALCAELVQSGLVALYGDGLACIPGFTKHQHINPREAASVLPENDASARVEDASPRDSDEQGGREGKGKERKGKEGASERVGSATAARTYLGWVQSLTEDQDPLPADDPVFTYAAKVGLPGDFVALAWLWFENTYGPDGTRGGKRYADWRKVFRNAVEGNWAKAWYSDGDGYRLTTVGLQLQRSQREAA